LCRYEADGEPRIGFYLDDRILPLTAAVRVTGASLPQIGSLRDILPGGAHRNAILSLQHRFAEIDPMSWEAECVETAAVKLLVPEAKPNKIILLAGNYAKHIEEGGSRAEERTRTFPYCFMKPPSTTLTHPGDPIRVPPISPDQIDWEIELGVVMGRVCRGVSEVDALSYVAGYTVVNDISDRGFKPNPGRTEREKDTFFDWQHGKWHDTFCPVGPCILPADEVADPQQLHLTLKVNGEVEQDAPATEMIFPVAAIIEFISSFVTLEPGDIISTGTPDGVGKAKGKFLHPGDEVEAYISQIGSLKNPIVG
jgi:2-keto-4-pentenoate hydratase/2-oxohepta-3-ene-1,7-dioic acid hydratase in catechol pathway